MTHTLRGREGEVTALGRTWKTGRMTLNVIDAYLDWVKKVLPDPLQVATADVLRLEKSAQEMQESSLPEPEKARMLTLLRQQQERVTELGFARASSYLSWTSPEVQAVLRTPRGAGRMLYHLLKEHQPEVTEEQAWEVLVALGAQQQAEVFSQASGKVAGPSPTDPPKPARHGRNRSRGGKSTKA